MCRVATHTINVGRIRLIVTPIFVIRTMLGYSAGSVLTATFIYLVSGASVPLPIVWALLGGPIIMLEGLFHELGHACVFLVAGPERVNVVIGTTLYTKPVGTASARIIWASAISGPVVSACVCASLAIFAFQFPEAWRGPIPFSILAILIGLWISVFRSEGDLGLARARVRSIQSEENKPNPECGSDE